MGITNNMMRCRVGVSFMAIMWYNYEILTKIRWGYNAIPTIGHSMKPHLDS